MKDGKNSYDIAITNLKKVLEAGVHGSVHIVTHPYNVGFLVDSVVHLYSQGVKSIGIGTVEKTIIIGKEFVKTFLSEMNLISMKIITGELAGLSIDLFNSVKSVDDVRCYIREGENGKIVAESYGRVDEDVTSDENYHTDRCADKTTSSYYIEHIRQVAYDNHQKNIKNI